MPYPSVLVQERECGLTCMCVCVFEPVLVQDMNPTLKETLSGPDNL